MLEDKILNETTGGISATLWVILGGIASFIIGLVDGMVRPLKCN